MSLKPAIAILTAILPCAAIGQEPEAMQKGEAALASKMWELATYHFEQLLASDTLDPAKRPDVAIRLCEALIRDGRATDALQILDQSLVAQHPETEFWKGQALAASGRFADATTTLKALLESKDSPYRKETALTVASLELALGHAESAIKTLNQLVGDGDPVLATKARMQQALILLDLDRIDEAAELMPDESEISERDHPKAWFLNANLLLRQNQFEQAAEQFQKLIDNPSNLSMKHYHSAVIGMADAITGQGKPDAAAELLLNFIQDHPESPHLEEIFKRLLQALPENPSTNNPVLVRLGQWISPQEIPATGPVPTAECHAVSAWPSEPVSASDLQAFALYTRAAGLNRIKTTDARDQARSLLTRLRVEYPQHFLTSRSLLMMARWHMEAGEFNRASHLLATLQQSATSPLIKGQAAFLNAESIHHLGDEQTAAGLFAEAADLLSGIEADAASFNAALVQLTAPPDDGDPVIPGREINNGKLAADLQLERALANEDPAVTRSEIENFLLEHPDHPRVAEARLAAAKAAIDTPEPDLSFARAQIETLEADPDKISQLPPAAVAMVKLRIDDLAANPDATIAAARTLVADFPSSPEASEASFILGRNLFATGNYNDARLTFEKIASHAGDPKRSQAAWLLAARSAALVPTSQSQHEALGLYDKAIAIDAELAPLTKLEKARLMIDMNLLTQAADFLGTWFASLTPEDPLYLPAGMLLGESIYAQGGVNPSSLEQALGVYDQLLGQVEKHSATYDRLQYLRGMALEQLPAPELQGRKRNKEALVAYYSVLERDTPPEQWHYFEMCGFRALALLEKANRWEAAIACAKKIASFKGPRADEATARANQIQLKYMIWDE